MVMLNNLKVKREGARINATISVPRQLASETLAKTMGSGAESGDKGGTPQKSPVPDELLSGR
jgi:hypothetical protein